MIGVIGPLVQGKRELRGTGKSIALFTLGAMAGAALTGAVIGVIAGAVRLAWDVPALAVGVVGCLLVIGVPGPSAPPHRPLWRRPSRPWSGRRESSPSGHSGASTWVSASRPSG